MDVLDLEQSKTQAAYVMPSHQYPTGIVMPVKRRQELLSWAYRGENRYVIEDDYDSEFRYKGRPIPALQGMDQGEGSFIWGHFHVPLPRRSAWDLWCFLESSFQGIGARPDFMPVRFHGSIRRCCIILLQAGIMSAI